EAHSERSRPSTTWMAATCRIESACWTAAAGSIWMTAGSGGGGTFESAGRSAHPLATRMPSSRASKEKTESGVRWQEYIRSADNKTSGMRRWRSSTLERHAKDRVPHALSQLEAQRFHQGIFATAMCISGDLSSGCDQPCAGIAAGCYTQGATQHSSIKKSNS